MKLSVHPSKILWTSLLVTSLGMIVPQSVQAKECYEVQQNVRYCAPPSALKLGHVREGEKSLSLPLPHTRVFFSNETMPFSATVILSIPVQLPADRSGIEPSNLFAVFRDMIDANTHPKGTIKDAWMAASDMNGKTAVTGEFQALSASGNVNANYVFDAWLETAAMMVLVTFDGEDKLGPTLREQHLQSRASLELRP